MNSSSNRLHSWICFLLIVSCILAFEVKEIPIKQKDSGLFNSVQLSQNNLEQRKDGQCATPQVFEWISKFTLPLNDVSLLLNNQYSRNNISNIAAPNKVTLFDIAYRSHLMGNKQSENYTTPLKATVFNDQIEFIVEYKINVTELTYPRNHTFTAQTKISNIAITYEKEFSLGNNGFTINTLTLKLDPSMMTSTFSPAPDAKQAERIDTAIKGTTQSLYFAISKMLSVDEVKKFMQLNIKNAPISKVYSQNPYNYNYQDGRGINVTIPIDVSTIWFNTTEGSSSLSNGITGKMPNNNKYCNTYIPDFTTTGGQLFFSKQFIQNFVQYNVVAFSGWQNIKVDRTTVRSTLLQWKLMDLDYVVDGLWNDLWNVYQNEIYFTCSAKENVAAQLNPLGPKLHLTLKWMCQGFVKLNETKTQKVMEFMPRINHIADMKVYDNSLQVYVNVLNFVDCEFNEVRSMSGDGVYKVKENNMKLIQKLMESVFNDFRVYTIGNRFWFGENTKSLVVDSELKGVWVF